MARFQQKRTITPPTTNDTGLIQYSATVQSNAFDLWQLAHDHTVPQSTKDAYAALTTDAQRVAFIAQFLGLV